MKKGIICADIGGTNSRFAYFEIDDNSINLIAKHQVPTATMKSDDDFFNNLALLTNKYTKPDFYCFGLAGIINKNECSAKLSNASLFLDFSIFIAKNQLKIGKNFFLVNDFTLQAYASFGFEGYKTNEAIENNEHFLLYPKDYSREEREENLFNVRAALGAGTGIGAACLMPLAHKSWKVLESEAGHCEMPFYSKEERDFADFALAYLQKERLSAEDVLAARGISLLHYYIYNEELIPEQAVENFWKKSNNSKENLPLALYSRFLARFCKIYALSTLCIGGLYLGGGVLVKNPQILQSSSFEEEFYHPSSKMLPLLKKIPIYLMQKKDASLWGGVSFIINAQ